MRLCGMEWREGRSRWEEIHIGLGGAGDKMNVTPHRILDMGWAYARSRALATGIELDVFTQIANGKHTAKEIAQITKSSQRGMEMLLNALVGLELLTKDS